MSNKIRFIASKDTNYIFHMLSVARCGYDNAYGNQHRSDYDSEDLAVLKEHEQLLTVCGGTHCGKLYWIFVSQPACAIISAKAYYADLMEKATNHTLSEEYQKYADTICRICTVMLKHYDHYINNLWTNEEKKINQYIPQVLRLFQKTQFAEKAEALVGCTPPKGTFTATLVTSVEDGAEGIDISDEIDVFGIERTPADALYFIGHEYIIYLLFRALKEEHAFESLETWDLTEALAEYYLKQILGDSRFFTTQQKYVAFYESCPQNLSAAELYRLASSQIIHMKQFVTEHYIFNYRENTKAAQDIQEIAANQEACYAHICKVLEISPKFKIQYFLCESPQEVGAIYGDYEPCDGFADAPDKIYAVYNEQIQCIGYHEDAHILSYIIHRPSCTAVREGLAMFFDQTWWGIPNLSWTKRFLENNKYIAIDALFQESVFHAIDCSVTYPIVGAFTQWLIESYGIAQYLQFYRQQDIVSATQTVYQKTSAELNQAFINYVRKHEIDPNLKKQMDILCPM